MTLLPKAEECWRTTTPTKHWQAWLERDKSHEEEVRVLELIREDLPASVCDIGCGSGRYAHALPHNEYFGFDPWDQTVRYAREWAKSKDIPNCKFAVGGVFDDKVYDTEAVIYLTLNVFRHFQEPLKGYKAVWDHLPVGSIWVTDFLTAPKEFVDGDFSTVISDKTMYDFLFGKKHTEVQKWFHEVGDWYLTRLTK
jgi:SAM-dependent methyltransferase